MDMENELYFATDHAGFHLKEVLKKFAQDELGLKVKDFGAFEYNPDDDYPDFIKPLAQYLSRNSGGAKAIILGGSGQGEAIVANRFKGVRAVVINCENIDLVRLGRRHNDANVLSLGARFISEEFAKEALSTFLKTNFEGEERHLRRIKKIDNLS